MKKILSIFQLCLIGFSLFVFPFMTTAQDKNQGMKEPTSENPTELVQLGAVLLRQQKFEEALAHFAKAVRLNPKDFRPQALMGIAYQSQKNMKSASESFAMAIQLNPTDKQLYVLKAGADMRRNAVEDALLACVKAIDLDSKYAEAHLMLGQILQSNEKRRDEVMAAFRTALKNNPRSIVALENLASMLEQDKDLKGAEDLYRQSMATDPKKMNGRFALGRMLVTQGRLAEARELWNGRTSDEDDTFPNFIVLLERAEMQKRAADALAQKPNDPAALVEMGLAVMEGDSWVIDGRQERAMTYFQQALKINPKYARAQYGICKGYISNSQYGNHSSCKP